MKRNTKVGLVTSGGDCQGLNAAIRGVGKALFSALDNVEIYGMYDGYRGLIEGDYVYMERSNFSGILTEGGTILGTSRQKYIPGKAIVDEDGNNLIPAMLETYNRLNLDCLVVMGGNGTQKSAKLLMDAGMNVVTLPKTIDNDIWGTDTTFGFQSAVDIATNVIDYIHSTASSHSRVFLVELMGRDAGWLTASSIVATHRGNGPDLIYLPESPFDTKKFFDQAMEVYNKKKRCLVALSEGIRDAKGNYIGAATGTKDSFNHTQLGGVASYLADSLTQKFNVKTRAIEFSLPTRAAGHIASLADQKDAITCGKYAVELAVAGKTGVMVTLARSGNKTVCNSLDLAKIANEVQEVPQEYIIDDGSNISEKFLDYVLPLIEGEVHHDYKDGIPVYFDSAVLPKV